MGIDNLLQSYPVTPMAKGSLQDCISLCQDEFGSKLFIVDASYMAKQAALHLRKNVALDYSDDLVQRAIRESFLEITGAEHRFMDQDELLKRFNGVGFSPFLGASRSSFGFRRRHLPRTVLYKGICSVCVRQ